MTTLTAPGDPLLNSGGLDAPRFSTKKFGTFLFLVIAVHALSTLILFAPFIFRGHIPAWSTDNLFGSYPAAVHSARNFLQGFSGWMPFYLNGVNFFASVNNLSYSPFMIPVFLLPAQFLWAGLTVLQLVSFFLVGVLGFLVFERILTDRGWALFASIVYQLCLQTLYSLQTFPNIFMQVLFLAGSLAVWNLDNWPRKKNLLVLTVSFTGIILSGHIAYGFHYFFFILVQYLYRHGLGIRNVFNSKTAGHAFYLSVLISLLIGSIRWLPFAESLAQSSRVALAVLADHSVRPHAWVHLFLPEIFGITNPTAETLYSGVSRGYGGNLHEFFHYYGIVGIFLVGLSFVDSKVRGATFWKILSFFYILHWARIMPIGFLSNLFFYPFLHGTVMLGMPFSLAVLAGHSGKCLSGDTGDSVPAGNFAPEINPLYQRCLWLGCLTIGALTYAMLIWHGLWETSPGWSFLFKGLVFLPLLSLLGLYAARKNPADFRLLKRINIAIWTALALGIFVYTGSLVFQGSSRIYVIAAVGTCVTIVMAPFALAAAYSRFAFRRILIVLAAILCVIAFIVPISSKARHFWAGPVSLTESLALLWLGISKLTVIFTVFCSMLFLRSRNKISAALFCGLCCVISFIDLMPVFRTSTFAICRPFLKVKEMNLFQPRVRDLELDLKNYRVNYPHQLVPAQPAYSPVPGNEEISNIFTVYEVPSYGGINSQYQRQDVDFFKALTGSDPHEIGIAAHARNERFLDLIGARYDYRSGELNLRPNALARFMLFSRQESTESPEDQLRRLADPAFNPHEEVALTRDAGFQGNEEKGRAAEVVEYEAPRYDTIRLNVTTAEPKILLFNDSFDPGWKARIDAAPAEILRANYKFMAVVIPSGTHRIELTFRPMSIQIAFFLFIAGSFLFCAFMIYPFRNRRMTAALPDQGA